MKGYKIMRQRYYSLGGKVLTQDAQYGNRIRKCEKSLKLAEAAVDVCSYTGIAFGQMIDLLHGLKESPDDVYLPRGMKTDDVERLKALAENAPSILDGSFGATFWETLYERIRREERPACPSRMDSYFSFQDKTSLRLYKAKHWSDKMGDKLACVIDFSHCYTVFEADMVVLDDIDGDMNFSSAVPQVLRYWDQEFTSQPIVETLLQGCVVLGAEVVV